MFILFLLPRIHRLLALPADDVKMGLIRRFRQIGLCSAALRWVHWY
jgi:hypothetical protein